MYLETAVFEEKVTSVVEGQITDAVYGSCCLLFIQSSSASKLMTPVYHSYSMLSFGCIKTGRLVSNRRSKKKLFKAIQTLYFWASFCILSSLCFFTYMLEFFGLSSVPFFIVVSDTGLRQA